MYTVQTDDFRGPLDKLLELVQKEKLDINRVSLARVTAGFLVFLSDLKENEEVSNSVLADFLVIASKLILIKSKVLIPELGLEEEEEEEIIDLEIQLKIYKKIKEAETNIDENWSESPTMGTREFLAGSESIFYPTDVAVFDMKEALSKIIKEIRKLKPVEKIKREVINLQDKIKDIMTRVSNEPIGFKKFFKSGSKIEVVVLFLAILHLFRDEKIYLEQDKRFGEIQVRKNG